MKALPLAADNSQKLESASRSGPLLGRQEPPGERQRRELQDQRGPAPCSASNLGGDTSIQERRCLHLGGDTTEATSTKGDWPKGDTRATQATSALERNRNVIIIITQAVTQTKLIQ